jgi:hypothetical protein
MSAFGGKADMASYSTFGNCGHRAPDGSFILPARFFAQSAVEEEAVVAAVVAAWVLPRIFRKTTSLILMDDGAAQFHRLFAKPSDPHYSTDSPRVRSTNSFATLVK